MPPAGAAARCPRPGCAAAGVRWPRQHPGRLLKGHQLAEQSCLQAGRWELPSEEGPVSAHRRDTWQVRAGRPGARVTGAANLRRSNRQRLRSSCGALEETTPATEALIFLRGPPVQLWPGFFSSSFFVSVLRSEASWGSKPGGYCPCRLVWGKDTLRLRERRRRSKPSRPWPPFPNEIVLLESVSLKSSAWGI